MKKLLLFIFFLTAWGSSCWAQTASYKVQNKETAPGVNERRGYGNNVIYLTFGGCDWTANNKYIQHNTGKNSATVTDSYKDGSMSNATPNIDGFQAYIAGNCNPKDELGYNWGFGPSADGTEVAYEQSATTRLRRFNIPCRGAFFKFEPMAEGTLSVYLFQNGCINQQKNSSGTYELNKNQFSYRPIYILDEAGEAVALEGMQTTAKVRYSASQMPNGVEVVNNPMEPIYYSWVVDYWRNHGAGTTCEFLKLNSNNKAEAVNFQAGVTKAEDIFLLDCGISKYTFKVKAGKTYFVFAQRSKSGLAGFQFSKTSNGGGTVTMTEGNTYSAPTNKSDVTVVYKNRSLKADVWQPICLPFSVSEQQVKTIFGDGTEIAHFDNTANDRLTLKKHIYHSIIAGVPCFIKSKQAFNGDITFQHVTIEKDVPEVVGSRGHPRCSSMAASVTISCWAPSATPRWLLATISSVPRMERPLSTR
jgi:hypothetical protein